MSKTKKVKVLVDVFYSRIAEFEMDVPAGTSEEMHDYVNDNFFEHMPDMDKITLHEDAVNHEIISISDQYVPSSLLPGTGCHEGSQGSQERYQKGKGPAFCGF